MNKSLFIKRLTSLVLGLFLVVTLTLNIHAANITDNVTQVGSAQRENLWGGVTLDRMHVQSKLHGVPTNGNTYDWDAVAITAENNPAIKIVTWGLKSSDGVGYKAGTTLEIAKNYEATHPGYTVVAAINGDFFANAPFTQSNGVSTSKGTFEPINTWVADGGKVYKPVTIANPDHNVVGLFEDRSYIFHLGTWYNENGDITYSDSSYAGTSATYGQNLPTFTEQAVFSIGDYETTAWSYKQKASLNEKAVNIFWEGKYLDVDVTGYTVWKAKTDRLSMPSDGFQEKYFVGQSLTGWTYNLEYTKYYMEGRFTEVQDITTISEVEDGWCYIVTKDRNVLSKLARAVPFTAQYELTGDWENVNSAIGTVNPVIIEGKRTGYVGVNDQYLNTFKPKTVLAFKEDGTCIFFFMGPGPLSKSSEGGPSSIELAEMLEKLGAVNAFCLDGGGSSSIIYNNGNDFVELNTPTDGKTRSIGNAVLMVVEDINLEPYNLGATKVSFTQSEDMAESDLVRATLHINGQSFYYFAIQGAPIEVRGLTPNTTYEYYWDYTIKCNGELLECRTNVQTITTLSEDPEPPVHEHVFVDGKCECGEIDPEWKEEEHVHEFVEGKCECGEIDPEWKEEEHVHEFVNGKCECGEKEPQQPGGTQTPPAGGFNCNMGFVSIIPIIAAAALLLIKKRK